MRSATKAEVPALYLDAQEALAIHKCLLKMGHPQLPTSLKTDNILVRGILTITIKQKRYKAVDT